MRNVSDILTDAARRFPQNVALCDRAETLTYAELDAHASRLAALIGALSSPGGRVAILSLNRTEFVETLYGVPRAGRVVTPLNFRLAVPELVRILGHCEAEVLIAEREYETVARSLVDQLPHLHALVWMSEFGTSTARYEVELVGPAPRASGAAAKPQVEDPAWLIYTSGTTGRPKGVTLSTRNLITEAMGMTLMERFQPTDTFLLAYTLAHVGATQLIASAYCGMGVILERRLESGSFVDALLRHRPTACTFLGPQFKQLQTSPDFVEACESVRFIQYGGQALPHKDVLHAVHVLDRAAFYQNFGMTESAGGYMTLDAEAHRGSARDGSSLLGSIGRPQPLIDLRLVDNEMNDVALGDVGEMAIRGPQVMLGYWREPDLTSMAIVDNWLLTGDLARCDGDGFYVLDGRRSDMIITGGENVYPLEVENALLQHPAVAEAAVFGVADEVWGERVVACVVPHSEIAAEELRQHVRASLASFKVPKDVHVVEELPRNQMNKVIKKQLEQRFSDAH